MSLNFECELILIKASQGLYLSTFELKQAKGYP